MNGSVRGAAASAAVVLVLAGGLPARAADPGPPGEEGLGEELVVTATRTARPLKDVPAAVTVLPRAELERSPTKTTDELLRSVPSFGMFRRSSSLAADPSATGATLRGVGGSAASRSLVLVDGIPANDPFFASVYWRAMPRLGMQRIEVVPGGGSALYGNYALSGVTQVFTRPIAGDVLDVDAQVGAFETAELAAYGAGLRGPVGASLEVDGLTTGGYWVVPPEQRGAVDRRTAGKHASATGRLELQAAPTLQLGARATYFYQDYNGGTEYTTASVNRLEYGATARWTPAGAGSLDAALFGHASGFTQDRARITNAGTTRSAEARNAHQSVPVHDLGAGLVWTSPGLPLAGTHALSLGADGRTVSGIMREDSFPAAPVAPTARVWREVKAEQRLYGLFAQDVWDLSPAAGLEAALRWDGWQDRDASRTDRAFDGTETRSTFPDRSATAVSPRLGGRVRALDWLTLRGAAYGSFRAPDLDELYRPFQVGTVLTLPNENLKAEKLRGVEAGLAASGTSGLSGRLTGYWSELSNPVSNVTLNATTRQKQNLGKARVRGLEAEAGWRFARAWSATASYTLADSEVTEAPTSPAVVGKQFAQTPKHRGAAQVTFDDPTLLTASVQAAWLGKRYEDDLNSLVLGQAFLVDVSASRRVLDGFELFVACENLLDERYLVGRSTLNAAGQRTGVDTVGQPRFVHGGIRFRSAR